MRPHRGREQQETGRRGVREEMAVNRWSPWRTFLVLFVLVQGFLVLTLFLGEKGVLGRRVADSFLGLLFLLDLALIMAFLQVLRDRFARR